MPVPQRNHIICITDSGRPGMQVKKVQFTTTPLSKAIGLVDLMLFVLGPGLVAWLVTNDSITSLLYGLGGFAIIALLRSVARYRSQKISFSNAKAHLRNNGFAPDLEFGHMFVVDSTAKKIAFMSLVTMEYEIYSMNEILSCKHQWVSGAGSNGNVRKQKNFLVFNTTNPHNPIYKFWTFDHATGELWMARINAMLNS